jgi:hypothetical protein
MSQSVGGSIGRWPSRPPPGALSLSSLSFGTFDECPRKWLNQYRSGTFPYPLARSLRAEGRVLPWAALAGRLVDDVLKDAFREYKEEGVWEIDLYRRAEEILEKLLEDSARFARAVGDPTTTPRDWPPTPQPLDRHLFGEPPSDEELGEVLERVNVCLSNFLHSGLREGLMERFPRKYWRCPKRHGTKPPVWFDADGVAVYAVFDFMIHSPERTLIIDWKAGNPGFGAAKAREQLHWYAAYAMDDLGVPAERLGLLACWLGVGPLPFLEYEEPVDVALVERLRGEWSARAKELESAASAPRKERIELFPMTERIETCKRCKFRSCEGAARNAEVRSAL